MDGWPARQDWLAVVLVFLTGARALASVPAEVGQKVPSLAFHDDTGKTMPLEQLTGTRATVVVFLSFDCPVSMSYCSTLANLAREYARRGVAVVGVDGTGTTAVELAGQVHGLRLPFPVFADPGQAAADAFGARTTPEAFVLDAKRIVRYRGRIDDGYASRLKKNAQAGRQDLRVALDEMLAGKPVSRPVTPAVGCPIRRERASPPAEARVTFHRDVLPILQRNCQSCHRPGEVGPFSLLSYRQAAAWADDIKEYTTSRRMPPWKPADGPPFHGERKLSGQEIAMLAAWVDAGAPEGNPHDAPPPRSFLRGWQLGQPDLVLRPDAETHVAPTGRDLFRVYVLPTGLTRDQYISAVEFRPGNPRVVHHALVFFDGTGQGRRLEEKEKGRPAKANEPDRGPGYPVNMGVGFRPQGGMGGWAPGQMPRPLPDGTAYLLPRGADVILQVHYHRDGRAETDQPSVGLYFARKPVSQRFQGMVVRGRFWMIPPGEDHYDVHGRMWVRRDCELHSVMPHMHMLGREIKVTMTPPGGATRTLVAIDDWDYNWQESYFFKEPIHVPAGTRFDISAVYDNSAGNPNNPFQPPRPVLFGEQTTNEMCFGFFGATSDRPGRIRFSSKPPEDQAARKP